MPPIAFLHKVRWTWEIVCMIELHTLSRDSEAFHLNPDLIERIEAVPDCHIWLTTGAKLAVTETVDEVVAAIRKWRVDILARALMLAK